MHDAGVHHESRPKGHVEGLPMFTVPERMPLHTPYFELIAEQCNFAVVMSKMWKGPPQRPRPAGYRQAFLQSLVWQPPVNP